MGERAESLPFSFFRGVIGIRKKGVYVKFEIRLFAGFICNNEGLPYFGFYDCRQ